MRHTHTHTQKCVCVCAIHLCVPYKKNSYKKKSKCDTHTHTHKNVCVCMAHTKKKLQQPLAKVLPLVQYILLPLVPRPFILHLNSLVSVS